MAQHLLEAGIELSDIYQRMYVKKIDDLAVTAYILNNYHISEHGVAYYLLDAKVQNELNITTERGKENVNLFSNIEGIGIWCSITEDPKDKCWRISIRSKGTVINQVAAKWGGGGHAQASGAQIKNLTELDAFINAPYGDGFSPELKKEYKQLQLRKIIDAVNTTEAAPDSEATDKQEMKNLEEIQKFDDKHSDSGMVKLAYAEPSKMFEEISKDPEYIRQKNFLKIFREQTGDLFWDI